MILDGEQIVFLRTVENIPDCFTEEEWAERRSGHFIHELGYISNVLPDYETVIRDGLLALRKRGDEYCRRVIDAVLRLSDRYADEARRIGAVNTITRTADGRMRGDNTDYFGFALTVRSMSVDLSGKKALVLGEGGLCSVSNGQKCSFSQ